MLHFMRWVRNLASISCLTGRYQIKSLLVLSKLGIRLFLRDVPWSPGHFQLQAPLEKTVKVIPAIPNFLAPTCVCVCVCVWLVLRQDL